MPNNGRKKTKNKFICQLCKREFNNKGYKQIQKFCSLKCWHNTSEWLKIITNNGRNQKGKKHYNWQGGKSKNKRTGFKYYKWRSKVFQRDNWTCQTCGIREIYLEAHHIKSWSKYPKLRYILNNGITLCLKCHKLTNNYTGKNYATNGFQKSKIKGKKKKSNKLDKKPMKKKPTKKKKK